MRTTWKRVLVMTAFIVSVLMPKALEMTTVDVIAHHPPESAQADVIAHHPPESAQADAEPIILSESDLKCLVDNVYYEAGNQSTEGKKAVAFVTLNRLFHPKYPSSVCEVVHQKATITKRSACSEEDVYSCGLERKVTVCQFSWACMKKKYFERDVWHESKQVVLEVLRGYNQESDPTLGALFYHAKYVAPGWKLSRTTTIGDHIFYK